MVAQLKYLPFSFTIHLQCTKKESREEKKSTVITIQKVDLNKFPFFMRLKCSFIFLFSSFFSFRYFAFFVLYWMLRRLTVSIEWASFFVWNHSHTYIYKFILFICLHLSFIIHVLKFENWTIGMTHFMFLLLGFFFILNMSLLSCFFCFLFSLCLMLCSCSWILSPMMCYYYTSMLLILFVMGFLFWEKI